MVVGTINGTWNKETQPLKATSASFCLILAHWSKQQVSRFYVLFCSCITLRYQKGTKGSRKFMKTWTLL